MKGNCKTKKQINEKRDCFGQQIDKGYVCYGDNRTFLFGKDLAIVFQFSVMSQFF